RLIGYDADHCAILILLIGKAARPATIFKLETIVADAQTLEFVLTALIGGCDVDQPPEDVTVASEGPLVGVYRDAAGRVVPFVGHPAADLTRRHELCIDRGNHRSRSEDEIVCYIDQWLMLVVLGAETGWIAPVVEANAVGSRLANGQVV